LRCCEHGGGGKASSDAPPPWFNVRISDCRKADAQGVVRRKAGSEVKLDETIFQIPARGGVRGGAHRAHLLDEMVKLLPDGIQQFRKRLVDIVEASDGSGDAVLHFADGTTAQHSAVIGCDGIKSKTREVVLGAADARPVFSGKYAYRGLIPMEKAVELLGEEQTSTSQMYSGYKGHVLTFPIANGTILNGTILLSAMITSTLTRAQWWLSAARTNGQTRNGW
jgi:salicylate hydroxylase